MTTEEIIARAIRDRVLCDCEGAAQHVISALSQAGLEIVPREMIYRAMQAASSATHKPQDGGNHEAG